MNKTEIRVNFYDCDPAGIVFFANIFKFAHIAYERLFNNLKLQRNYFEDDDYVLPIIHAEADYSRPLKAGQVIIIEVSVSRLEESSFELKYNFTNSQNEITAEVRTVHVSVNKIKFEKCSLPAELSDELQKLKAE